MNNFLKSLLTGKDNLTWDVARLLGTNPLQDANGNLALSFSGQSVTNNVSSGTNWVRIVNMTSITESLDGSGGWDYASTGSAGAFYSAAHGTSNVGIPAGQDGWIALKYGTWTGTHNAPVLALSTATTDNGIPACSMESMAILSSGIISL